MRRRIRQFYINATDKMTDSDYEYVESILSNKELSLFNKMLKSEQKHSVRVAKDIESMIEYIVIDDPEIVKNKDLLIKAGLLHDIGKSKVKINIFEKSIIVILNKITKSKLRKINNKKIDCYYNHGYYSYEYLKGIIKNEMILNIVKNHHTVSNDKCIEFFKKIDDRN